ncbi:DUF4810 domain-containing protein [Bordetella genomosp. 4]|uniref:DUF4810 domain-containing protein n=1 Tax=Bordetella genomosp. 4 TaxID=463044 RepID=A0A261V0Z1_9BORD|nr:DUF4810 domain-containing protein [Bordetella genomosp. 4]OZI54104.1 hypothetical protein CAL21_00560 [Bordetella genomosp. 4]OZI67814.1 hypothetical protein CAL20_01900 [Bordetella genomosp. 4]
MLNQSSRAWCHAPGSVRLLQIGLRLSAACVAGGVLAACVQAPKHMYNWKSYQPAVYAYLNDEGVDYAAQAQDMELNVETARSSNTALPPGFRAHLGLLYLKLGEDSRAVEQLQGEKLAFPESTSFMDFLMRNLSPVSAAPQKGEPEPIDTDPNGGTSGLKTVKKEGA